MSKTRILTVAALAAFAVPVFAQSSDQTTQTTTTTTVQTAPPSTTQIDQAKANQQAAAAMTDPNVHWTMKERAAIFSEAPYVRPRDMWEIDHMFREMDGNSQRVIFDAISNAVQANAGDFYQRRAAEEAYWQQIAANPSSMTTVTTTPAGTTAVTTTTTTAPVVVTTPTSSYSPTTQMTADTINGRPQAMTGAGMAVGRAMSDYAAWELMQRDLNAQDRTTFRREWDKMTDSQQTALMDIVKQSSYYFTARNAGYYYYYNP